MKKTYLFLLLFIHISLTTSAQTFYVDSAATGANDGTSWVNAYTDLQIALANISSGEIWVAKGTYKPSISTFTASFYLKNNVTIYGGFIGNETILSQRDWQNNITTLSGEIGSSALTDNSYTVVSSFNNDTTAILDGFSITAGYTSTSGMLQHINGAGIYTYRSLAKIVNCKIHDNNSLANGGGMYNEQGGPTIENCHFIDNDAVFHGGGVFSSYSNLKIINCLFENNIAFHTNSFTSYSRGGGAIYNYFCTTNIQNTVFTSNRVIGYSAIAGGGGAILNYNGQLVINNCYFENNIAETRVTLDRYSSGGAIQSYSSNDSITNSVFKSNEAYSAGAISYSMSTADIINCEFIENNGYVSAGAINSGVSNLNINRCNFERNTAFYYVPWVITLSSAGAIYNYNSTDTISNCSFRENTATEYGGAIYNENCSPMLINNTFTYNSANIEGGSLFNYNATPSITNCIFWNSSPNEIKDSSSTSSVNNSIIKGGYTGTNIINQYPYFIDIANNVLQLACNSPAIDVGDNSIVIDSIDLGGLNRIINSIIDMGAYEYSSTSPIFTTHIPKYICTGDSLFIGGAYQYNTGAYSDTLVSIYGCDSLIITDLEVSSQVYHITWSDTICQGDSIYLGGNYQSTVGTYMDTIYSVFGCDSIIYSTLSVNPSYLNNQSQSICEGDSVQLFGIYRNLANTYYDTLQAVTGCDSIQSITLTVNTVYDTNVVTSICQGDSVFLEGGYKYNGGLYLDSLQTTFGCDSIVTTLLSIIQPIYSTPINEFICDGDSILIGSIYANTEGTYRDTLISNEGCDSIATYILNIHNLPFVELANFTPDSMCLLSNSVTLPIATPLGGTYSGNGITGNQFSPQISGIGSHYIVYSIIDANLCSNKDSSIITVNNCVGINEFNESSEINLYPNPSSENIYIQFNNMDISKYLIKVYDIMGKLVYYIKDIDKSLMMIENSKIGKGFYIISIQEKNSRRTMNNKILLY